MWDDDDVLDEEWSEDDRSGDAESFTVSCPECGFSLHEDAEICSQCGFFLEDSPHTMEGKPMWFVILGLLGILATLFAMLQSL